MTSKPWLNEPDYKTWFDARTGLRCLVRRMPTGHLCGYVRVPRRLRKKILRRTKYGNVKIYKFDQKTMNLPIHGGVSFTGTFKSHPVVNKGKVESGYWIGFDCGHYFDYRPYDCHCRSYPEHYRDWKEVISIAERLAWKLSIYIGWLKRSGQLKKGAWK